MIIKVTVHDNDFYYKIMHFMDCMWTVICDESTSTDERVEEYLKRDKILEYVNPNYNTKFTPEIKEEIINYLKSQFDRFLDIKCNMFGDTMELLRNNFSVTIQKSFTDKDENGEAFYWFQHSGAIINQ